MVSSAKGSTPSTSTVGDPRNPSRSASSSVGTRSSSTSGTAGPDAARTSRTRPSAISQFGQPSKYLRVTRISITSQPHSPSTARTPQRASRFLPHGVARQQGIEAAEEASALELGPRGLLGPVRQREDRPTASRRVWANHRSSECSGAPRSARRRLGRSSVNSVPITSNATVGIPVSFPWGTRLQPAEPDRQGIERSTGRPGYRAMLADVTSGLSQWWAPVLAFAAGVLSFASPCVVPLVPGYLTFVSGTQGEEQRRPIVPILLFILGFGIVFTALGASASALRFIKSGLGLRLAGVVVLLFGAAMVLYALRLGRPELYAEKRPFLRWVKPGPAGALPLGMPFAAGWTPGVGPVRGGVLPIAGTQGGALKGATLLFVYSLGRGVPFLLMGLGVRAMMSSLDVIKRHYHVIAGVSGALMVGIGLLLVSGLWQRFLLPIISRLGQSSPPL